jgi:hypothetical protein
MVFILQELPQAAIFLRLENRHPQKSPAFEGGALF